MCELQRVGHKGQYRSYDVGGGYTVEKSREPIQKGFFATHKFNFVNKHLDNKPIESRSELKVENKPEKF